MFERFKKSRRDDQGASSVATREREARADEAPGHEGTGAVATDATARGDDRFDRLTPGERDRGVAAADSEADRSGEPHPADAPDRGSDRDADGVRDERRALHDRDADGVRDDRETTLDRDAARDDLGGGAEPVTPGERDRGVVAGDSRADRTGEPQDLTGDRDRDGVRDDHETERHGGRTAATAAGAGAAGAAAGAAARGREDRDARDRDLDRDRDRDRDLDRDRDMRGDRAVAYDRDEAARGRMAPVMGTDALDTMRARQRDRFGGIQWGSDFFGWLCAIGLASLLLAILVGAGVSLGLSTSDATDAAANSDTVQTIGIGGGIALLVVLAIAWFCGGYVAGRMARFDGARQGIGVWLWTLLAAIVVAVLAAVGGTEYDIFQRLNLPRIAVGDSTLTAGGAIAGAAAIVVTLLFAVLGGKVGERYHRRVDRVATHEDVADR